MAEKIRYEETKKRSTDQYQPPPEGLIQAFIGEDA